MSDFGSSCSACLLRTFYVVSRLPCAQLRGLRAGAEGLQLSKKDEQLDLLAQVLAAGAEDAAEEADDNTDGVAQRPAARRVVSSLASMSGSAPLLMRVAYQQTYQKMEETSVALQAVVGVMTLAVCNSCYSSADVAGG